ncbi:CDP-diacylglycerol--glycerol-3-phosphate 3-phosphatidyltransferase [Demequina lignilytica]|uniref:CDP-diacylglycerol--glycerol-3-phosphate 3-phosphatidyltransferase n=1 Tax=Demequina lignilytica TaxID=3051663 RepID=A0AAW7M780_9MICO|nr:MULTISPECIES: CDP-diacylglycerol--glycerol-3-phosphate 3-phosphatidyltransferase [unclassified Demequina]MDN4477150.1 CDP-diacylglycerol--glycerol-3-phosphate 3-phosphatidyltransferase [Demequina sp. SYSU T00039-1]MDN4483998.1 CDP-diacylglycerol--glycerol-3-phosphate 3-phosphatidyltransferase [Demequina sp. SYSU T0a273]MDN4487323.1 CDP-diacylglycerol--glycerol-3-phosphate 3-phosphatidyltransferase [Demequina sp. SYSU T00039]MDN4491076.1 CDP-diacylglycerol--glycerol-3-phosphate 3-phosphatidyl
MTSALPNLLTVARLVVVPVMVVLLWADGGDEGAMRWWGVGLFMAAAATDYLDGYLARRWGVVSSFGKLADPIADKALVLAALVMIVLIDGVPWWPVVVIAVREVWVTVGRLLVAEDTVIAASRGGKLKTFAQLLAIWLYLLPGTPAWVDTAAWWVLMAATVLAVVTGVDYTIKILAAARHQRAGGREHG